MKTTELIKKIENGELDAIFTKLYANDVDVQKARYIRTIKNFEENYGVDRDVSLFSPSAATTNCPRSVSGNCRWPCSFVWWSSQSPPVPVFCTVSIKCPKTACV